MTATQIKWPWFERHFDFNFPPEKMPDLIERLRGTPARVTALVEALVPEVLRRQVDGSWSIQENLGHLADLEPLWIGRVEDILAGHETLREADLTNTTTSDARHNDSSLGEVLEAVRAQRQRLIDAFAVLSPVEWAASSIHPRLNQPMRLVDLCMFVAEHDDYHLARVTYLKQRLLGP